jgi:hypothetical protein
VKVSLLTNYGSHLSLDLMMIGGIYFLVSHPAITEALLADSFRDVYKHQKNG